jgi:hypothetical protein
MRSFPVGSAPREYNKYPRSAEVMTEKALRVAAENRALQGRL